MLMSLLLSHLNTSLKNILLLNWYDSSRIAAQSLLDGNHKLLDLKDGYHNVYVRRLFQIDFGEGSAYVIVTLPPQHFFEEYANHL